MKRISAYLDLLPRCIRAIQARTNAQTTEIVVLDNASRHASVKLARDLGCDADLFTPGPDSLLQREIRNKIAVDWKLRGNATS
jgi:hypothetical protein